MTIRFEERSTALFPFLKSLSLYGEKIISYILEDDTVLLYSVGEPVIAVAAVLRGTAIIAASEKEAAEELLFFLNFAVPCGSIVSDGEFFERSGDVFLLENGFGIACDIEIFEEKEDFSLFERAFDLNFSELRNKKLRFYSAFLYGERVGGIATENLYERSNLISMLCTKEGYRGRGIARSLLSAVYKEGERFYIMSKNKESDSFYRRIGLQKYGEYYLYEQLL